MNSRQFPEETAAQDLPVKAAAILFNLRPDHAIPASQVPQPEVEELKDELQGIAEKKEEAIKDQDFERARLRMEDGRTVSAIADRIRIGRAEDGSERLVLLPVPERDPVAIVGNEKGRQTREKIRRNFGMPRPEGYRKALRLMNMAARFRLPLVTFIDTPGAYPGVGAEERGQSEAIARNLLVMSRLPVPIVCTIIGEGGSGGALAIGVGDRVNMLEYSTYSVISPEGCASILWKDAANAEDAATALGITSESLKRLGLVDEVIKEPLGGAHKDPEEVVVRVADCLEKQLDELTELTLDELLEQRYQRLLSYGEFQD